VVKPWQQWTEVDWNVALFEHYFNAGEDDAPVTRLVVTARELAEVSGCDYKQLEELEERFVSIVRRTPDRINARFRPGYFQWPVCTEAPGAIVYLLFSCYVASGTDQVLSEGDFRRRMARTLGHSVETSYPLDGLAGMWENLQSWLAKARAAGCPYRELVLPNPGRMTRIGYSLRLAFPSRRDQIILNEIISSSGFSEQPPIPAMIRLLGKQLDRFSDSFREVYQQFRKLFHSGSDDLNRSPLLDAVREAIEQRQTTVVLKGAYDLDLLLTGEPDERGHLILTLFCNSERLPVNSRGLVTFPTDYAVDGFRFVFAFKSPDMEGADMAVGLLLSNELAMMLPGFNSSPLKHMVNDGIILVHRGSQGVLQCTPNLDIEGELRVLIRRDLLRSFLEGIASTREPSSPDFPSVYRDWHEICNIRADHLRNVDWSKIPELTDVRCLQQCVRASRITLVGGIPTGEPQTFFGHPTVLPDVKVSGTPTIVTVGRPSAATEFTLHAIQPSWFRLPWQGDAKPLDGEYTIKAQIGGATGYTLRKSVHFRAQVDSFGYRQPTIPERWLCESAKVDMVQWSPEDHFAAGPSVGAATMDENWHLIVESATSQESDTLRVESLIEICAAISVRRSGFGESEIIELFSKVLEIKSRSLVRLVLRSWVEAGYLDEALNCSWRSRRYFARQPRLALRIRNGQILARLLGLAPSVLIKQLRRRVESAGGKLTKCSHTSPWILKPTEISGLTQSQLNAISNEVGIVNTVWVSPLPALIAAVPDIRQQCEQQPLNYELNLAWSWSAQRFVEPSHAGASSVKVELYSRRQRFDRPDYYLVRQSGDSVFVSYSRNWALLVAAQLAGMQPYRIGPDGVLVSNGFPWVLLPLSLGRYIFAAGSGAAGPILDSGGRATYCYPLGGGDAARAVLTMLGFLAEKPAHSVPQWLSVLASAGGVQEPLLPLGPGALSTQRVPASLRPLLLAHIRSKSPNE
jgi:hypothetical protein